MYIFNDPLKDLLNADDVVPEALETTSNTDKKEFTHFIEQLEHIKETDSDEKVKQALDIVKFSLDSGMNPIVFCQYIQTAEYVGKYITEKLAANKKFKKVVVGIVTSRLADEERKMKIDALSQEDRHVLVCTDCLSEGVNLQQGFEAVIHYDLPWNPNRMEQRNGRIDRFGQTAKMFWYQLFTPRTTQWMTLCSMFSTKAGRNTQETGCLSTYRRQRRFFDGIHHAKSSMPRFLQEPTTWSFRCSIATQSGSVSRMKR